MITKRVFSAFIASAFVIQAPSVFADDHPHATSPGKEETQILCSVEEKLRNPFESLDIERCPFKDYIPFFYTIFTALNSLNFGNQIDAKSANESARSELYSILHATCLPEELNSEKLKEYSDQIESITAILKNPDYFYEHRYKIDLLRKIESFLGEFSNHLSEEKIGFRKLSANSSAESEYRSASMTNAPKLAQLYFERVSKVGRPRILIVGNGRAVAKKDFMDSLVSDPSGTHRYRNHAGYYNHRAWHSRDLVLGFTSWDEEYYKDSRYDYFLVDIDAKMRPDVCLDMENPNDVVSLGEKQWDFVIFEDFHTERAENAAKRLLKPGGVLLFNQSHENFYPLYSPSALKGMFPYKVYLIYTKPL